MLKELVKKFLKNELIGLVQSAQNIFKPNNPNPDETITADNYPAHAKIADEISTKVKFFPKSIILENNATDTNGSANYKQQQVFLDRGNLQKDNLFVGTYAHELGHLKYTNLHSKLNLGYLKLPYSLLLSATTNLYGIGLSAYAVMGDNKTLDLANGLFHHTGKYLIAAAITSAIFTRTKEHMADLFAYKQTGLLPTEYMESTKRHGIVGNVLKVVGDISAKLESGYPTNVERDFICKILGKKPKDASFVEQLKAEREQTSSNSILPAQHHLP